MPNKPARACRVPTCPRLASESHGYCEGHAGLALQTRAPDRRPSASARGYGNDWRRVRIEVLSRYRIPRADWPLWDVDHNPTYDPAIEPDHRKYELIPRLHADHSRKTAREDGGFGHQARMPA